MEPRNWILPSFPFSNFMGLMAAGLDDTTLESLSNALLHPVVFEKPVSWPFMFKS